MLRRILGGLMGGRRRTAGPGTTGTTGMGHRGGAGTGSRGIEQGAKSLLKGFSRKRRL